MSGFQQATAANSRHDRQFAAAVYTSSVVTSRASSTFATNDSYSRSRRCNVDVLIKQEIRAVIGKPALQRIFAYSQ